MNYVLPQIRYNQWNAGSTYVKLVIANNEALLGQRVAPTGIDCRMAARKMFDELRGELGLSPADINGVISTGYSRRLIDIADKTVTEIKAHAVGASWTAPEKTKIRTITDIGGQDSKVIVIDEQGETTNFAMNDKCAAGTGRFLEVLSRVFELNFDEFCLLSLQAKAPCRINSICAVFVESEVISLLARQIDRADIIVGIHRSLAKRVSGMARRVGLEPGVLLTGGVALNPGFAVAHEDELRMDICVAKTPQFNGAIGTAIIAGNLNGKKY